MNKIIKKYKRKILLFIILIIAIFGSTFYNNIEPMTSSERANDLIYRLKNSKPFGHKKDADTVNEYIKSVREKYNQISKNKNENYKAERRNLYRLNAILKKEKKRIDSGNDILPDNL